MSEQGPTEQAEAKLERLYFDSYLQMINDSVGTNMFRHFWVQKRLGRKKYDVLSDGYNSCAYYVGGILKIFGKVSDFHATVASTVSDLAKSGWTLVDEPKAGDILVWEAREYDDGWHRHIGFCIDENTAISNSWTEKVPVEHDIHFGEDDRQIEKIFRMSDWSAS